jgi:hypothetical protein
MFSSATRRFGPQGGLDDSPSDLIISLKHFRKSQTLRKEAGRTRRTVPVARGLGVLRLFAKR